MGGGSSRLGKARKTDSIAIVGKMATGVVASHNRAREEIAWRQVEEAMSPATLAVPDDIVDEDFVVGGNPTRSIVTDKSDASVTIKLSYHGDAATRISLAPAGTEPEASAVGHSSTYRKNTSRKSLTSAEDRYKYLPSTWSSCGGAAIEALLDHTFLIDAQYLLNLAESGCLLPRCQMLPSSARITTENLNRLQTWNQPNSLPILVVSYPWCAHPEHPPITQLPDLIPTCLVCAGWTPRKLIRQVGC